MPKSMHEDFARFFENPSREALRELLKTHSGEYNELDFKSSWPERSSLARHVLGIANSGGGCIIVGMEEEKDKTFSPIGLTA